MESPFSERHPWNPSFGQPGSGKVAAKLMESSVVLPGHFREAATVAPGRAHWDIDPKQGTLGITGGPKRNQ